jgi:hypothetical protein
LHVKLLHHIDVDLLKLDCEIGRGVIDGHSSDRSPTGDIRWADTKDPKAAFLSTHDFIMQRWATGGHASRAGPADSIPLGRR